MKIVKSFDPVKGEKELNTFLRENQALIPFSQISISEKIITVVLETDPRTVTRLRAGEDTYNDFYRNTLIKKSALNFWERMRVKKELEGHKVGKDVKDVEKELNDIDANITDNKFQLQMAQEQMDDVDRELADVKSLALLKSKDYEKDHK